MLLIAAAISSLLALLTVWETVKDRLVLPTWRKQLAAEGEWEEEQGGGTCVLPDSCLERR
ncbi:hypothetical protein AB4142_26455 [Variovorax sp. 2RAF20]